MKDVKKILGLKYPDEMVTRFFFKNNLDRRRGTVFELGCGNASNLTLFSAYQWNCSGLDISNKLLEMALENFNCLKLPVPYLINADMNFPFECANNIDVLLLASSIYYVHKKRAIDLVIEIQDYIKSGALVFCRFRTPRDYRYGKGEDLGSDCFKLNISETNELGCVNAFYDIESMLSVLAPLNIDPETLVTLQLTFDNVGLNGQIIKNDEIILWGTVR